MADSCALSEWSTNLYSLLSNGNYFAGCVLFYRSASLVLRCRQLCLQARSPLVCDAQLLV